MQEHLQTFLMGTHPKSIYSTVQMLTVDMLGMIAKYATKDPSGDV